MAANPLDALEKMGGEYDPTQTLRGLDHDQMPDGDYTLEAKSAFLEVTKNNHTNFKIVCAITDGPAFAGATVEVIHFLKSAKNISRMGAEFRALGVKGTEEWGKAVKLVDGIKAAAKQIVGLTFGVRKSADVSENDGKTYHNLNVLGLRQKGHKANHAAVKPKAPTAPSGTATDFEPHQNGVAADDIPW